MAETPEYDSLVEHMLHNQVEPHLRADKLRAAGVNIDVQMVSTDPDADGFEVTCGGCGRTARMPFEPPAGRVALCPRCIPR